MKNSLVCPLLPYYDSNMTSLGLWRLPLFSLNQSFVIQWTRASWLDHLTTTLVIRSLHTLRPHTHSLLLVLLSFTSTRLRVFLWQSPKNPPTILVPPSICPTRVNYFTDLGPKIFPSSSAIQIFDLTMIWVLSKSIFLCTNLFVVQSMRKSELLLL